MALHNPLSHVSHLPQRSFSHYHRRPRNHSQHSLFSTSPLSPHFSPKSTTFQPLGRHHRPSTLITHSYNSHGSKATGRPSNAFFSHSSSPAPHSPTPFGHTLRIPVSYGLQERPLTPVVSPRSAFDFTDYTPPPSPLPSPSPWYRSNRTLDNFDCDCRRVLSQSSDFSLIGEYGRGQCCCTTPTHHNDSAWYNDCASEYSLTNFSDISTRAVFHPQRRVCPKATAASAYLTPVRSRFLYCLPGSCG